MGTTWPCLMAISGRDEAEKQNAIVREKRMRIGFRLLLAGVIVLGLGLGTGLAAYQSSQQSASGAATGAPVASAAQNGAGQPAAQTGSGQAATQRGGMPAIGVVASVGDKEFSLKSESTATPVLGRNSVD